MNVWAEGQSLDKSTIRKKLRRRREQAFAFDRAEGAGSAALQLAEMGRSLFANEVFRTVAGYIPIGSEIDPRPLMMAFRAEGAKLCLPEVVSKGAPLNFRQWAPGDMLTSGLLSTLQPAASQPALVPDFVLVPLLGVDQSGVRIGQGGGFYDRTLPQLRAQGARAFGVAFDAQLVMDLPRESHDQLLDGVITPRCCKRWRQDGNMQFLAEG